MRTAAISWIAPCFVLTSLLQLARAQDACPSPGANICYSATADLQEPQASPPLAREAAIEAAYQFLYAQMDLYHRSTIIYAEPTYAAFYPSGSMGNTEALSIHAAETNVRRCGKTSLRIQYDPANHPGAGWAGINFQYPDGNWGDSPGRDLSGATKMTFWVRADRSTQVRFTSNAFDLERRVEIGQGWESISLDIGKKKLGSVVSPLGLVLTANAGAGARPINIYLDEIVVDRARPDEPRFVQSYLPKCYPAHGAANTAHTYDQALVLLAFLARRQPEDQRRAKLIAEALVTAQKQDRFFSDGRLRNAYASGELVDPATQVTRLPGQYVEQQQAYVEDEFAAGTDTGNMTWAGLALIQAHALLPPVAEQPYLKAALRLGEWVARHRVTDDKKGFSGGFSGFEQTAENPKGQSFVTYRSTEHNLDLVAFYDHLAAAVGRNSESGRRWIERREHAQAFVKAMLNSKAGGPHLWTGTKDDSDKINDSVIPLDPQTWSVLAVDRKLYQPALRWALGNCGAGQGRVGFDFNCRDGDGAWFEGTAQVAAALTWIDQQEQATPILARLREAQIRGPEARGALPAASHDGVTTGFIKWDKPWVYNDEPHIGATAWYLFAELGKNPFYLSNAAGE